MNRILNLKSKFKSREELAKYVEGVVREVVEKLVPDSSERMVPLGISARHVHITQEDLEKLFGPGYQLTKYRDLNQPGEFAANETLTVVGPNRRVFEKVRILGPLRDITQVELSYSDGIYLGIDLPHRLSGDIKGSAPIVLIGPKGVLQLQEGAIRAMRHLHIDPKDAKRLGLTQGQKVAIKTMGKMSVILNNVVVRIKEGLKLEMHVDTDEANAAGVTSENNMGIIL
jgi:putative phosphotransacetylase